MNRSYVLIGLASVLAAATSGVSWAEDVAPGVTFTTYNLSGPRVVYVMAIERERGEYKLKVGWPQKKRNFTSRAAVSTIAGLYDDPPTHDVLAAVNASFFGATPSISGAAASDGEMLEQPVGGYETFLFGPSRQPVIVEDIGHSNGTVFFANGTTTTLHRYNKTRDDNTVVAYTPQWGPTTATTLEGVEVVLGNVTYPMRSDKEVSGIVSAIHTGAASIDNAIPIGGMVLSVRGSPESTFLTNAKVGDRLRMRFDTTSGAYNNADMAITGLGWLVHNGAANTGNWSQYSTSFVNDRHPRTALGWNATHVYQLVVDGRSTASIGMTFQQLADFMIGTLACEEAVNLDGGGSSTMWVDGTVRNVPSDGSERAVANAVLLVKQDTPTPFPVADPFGLSGRIAGWDDKFTYNEVVAFAPTAPGGDGYVVEVYDPAGGAETMRRGDFGDADYRVEADIYCEYRPGVAGDGYERYGLFARDDGTGAFGLSGTSYGYADCYALTFDSDTGRIRAGKFVNGALTDFLESTPLVLAATAWREFRIECEAANIRYYIDDGEIANVTDTTFAHGYFGIGYRERFSNNANIHGARADNFAAASIGLVPPADIILESRDAAGTTTPPPAYTESGTWSNSTAKSTVAGLTGTGSRYTSYDLPVPGTDNATFVPDVITPARYEVWVTWGLGANCYDAQYSVQHYHGQTQLLVDQDSDENANTWVSLGQYWFAAGQGENTCSVNVSEATISGRPSETWHQRVYTDALMLTFVEWWPNGDYNEDGDVDLTDFAELPGCLTGPGGGYDHPECQVFDFDLDNDVDLEDFGRFQQAFGT